MFWPEEQERVKFLAIPNSQLNSIVSLPKEPNDWAVLCCNVKRTFIGAALDGGQASTRDTRREFEVSLDDPMVAMCCATSDCLYETGCI